MHRLSILVFASLSLLQLAQADAVLSAGSATVFPIPTPFVVSISISGVSDLYDYQFDVGFNPAVVHLQSDSKGFFLGSGAGATFFEPGFISNTSGTATFIADTLIGPISGASGSGALVALYLQAVGVGSSALTLSNVILQDSNGAVIPFSTQAGMIVVRSFPQ